MQEYPKTQNLFARVVARLIAMLIAAALAAFDTGVFYVVTTHVFHWTVTWPIVAAVYWVQDTTFGHWIRAEFKKEGVL